MVDVFRDAERFKQSRRQVRVESRTGSGDVVLIFKDLPRHEADGASVDEEELWVTQLFGIRSAGSEDCIEIDEERETTTECGVDVCDGPGSDPEPITPEKDIGVHWLTYGIQLVDRQPEGEALKMHFPGTPGLGTNFNIFGFLSASPTPGGYHLAKLAVGIADNWGRPTNQFLSQTSGDFVQYDESESLHAILRESDVRFNVAHFAESEDKVTWCIQLSNDDGQLLAPADPSSGGGRFLDLVSHADPTDCQLHINQISHPLLGED